jgi:hypothetical protein
MCDTMPDPLYRQGKLGWGRIRMSVPTTGAAEPSGAAGRAASTEPTVVRGNLRLPLSPSTVCISLFDMTGRQVMALRPGPNDVSRLAPGVYFARTANGEQRLASAKVIVAR